MKTVIFGAQSYVIDNPEAAEMMERAATFLREGRVREANILRLQACDVEEGREVRSREAAERRVIEEKERHERFARGTGPAIPIS